MRILVTGTEGYLGHVFAPTLLAAGHDVIGVDTGFYREAQLYRGVDPQAHTLFKDIRRVTVDDLEGVDAIVHMAELSNDPVGELSPTITYDINHKGSVHLARLAKQAGVRRFVYMSSCSVYGVASGSDMTEDDPTNPQTAYAECKVMVERDLAPMADDNFSPTFMRNATAFGASPRMRFDIVVNNLSGLAWTTKTHRDEQRRQPVATAGARARHLEGAAHGARRADREGAQPDLQRGQHRQQLSGERNRRDRRRRLPRMSAELWLARQRQPQLPRQFRQDQLCARLHDRLGRAGRSRCSCDRSSSRSRCPTTSSITGRSPG